MTFANLGADERVDERVDLAQVMEEVRLSRSFAQQVESGASRRGRVAEAKLSDQCAKLREQLVALRSQFASELKLVSRAASTQLQTVGTKATAMVQRERNASRGLRRELEESKQKARTFEERFTRAEEQVCDLPRSPPWLAIAHLRTPSHTFSIHAR